MLSAARHSRAATTSRVDEDLSQTVRCQGAFMRTACIQLSLANRIPQNCRAQFLETPVFSGIYNMNGEQNRDEFQYFGRAFRWLGPALREVPARRREGLR